MYGIVLSFLLAVFLSQPLYSNNKNGEPLLSGIQACDPLLQRDYSSRKKSMESLQILNNIIIPNAAEDDVGSYLQKHTAKALFH